MIIDGEITYPGVGSTLLTWQPADPLLYAILVAVLTTVLSYQATAFLFDVAFGFKPRGEARVTDLATLLLAEDASLPSICAALWDNGRIARWKFHGNRPCPRQASPARAHPLRFQVGLKFIALLVLAPLINLVTIVLNIESDVVVSFEAAKFGGIALGVNENLTGVLPTKHSDMCSSYEPKYGRLETPITEFLICKSDVFVDARGKDDEPSPVATFKLSRSESGDGTPIEAIVAEFNYGKLRSKLVYHTDVYVNTLGKAYRLRPVLTLEQGIKLLKLGIDRQLSQCESLGPVESKLLSKDSNVKHQKWEVSQKVRCLPYAETQSKAVMVAMTEPLTLVNDDEFQILELAFNQMGERKNAKFESGATFPLLKRRRTFVSFVTLMIAVVCVFILRLTVSLVTTNDIYIGVELILKDKFGIPCCDSMLQSKRIVGYRDKTELWTDFEDKSMDEEHSKWASSRLEGEGSPASYK